MNRETDPNDATVQWLNAAETADALEDGMTVGIYELVETKRMQITRELK